MNVKLNPDPLPHGEATANLLIEGLSVMFFNDVARSWDVLFLRDEAHDFTLTIKGNGYRQKCPEKIDLKTSRIEISATKPIAPDWNQFPRGFWFRDPFGRRSSSSHPEDFRWVVDLSSSELPLHVSVQLKRTPGKGLTRLNVGDVIFYTAARTDDELRLALFDGSFTLPFGKTNELVGADIRCENGGEVIVRIDGKECDRLPHVPGKPYTITLSNHEPQSNRIPDEKVVGQYKRGDFRLYYDVLTVFGKYDLFCPATVIRTRDCDCETVQVSSLGGSAALPESLPESVPAPAKAETPRRVKRHGQADAPARGRTTVAKPKKGRAKK